MAIKVVMKPGAARKIRYLPTTARMLESHGRRIETRANSALNTSSGEQQGFRMSSQPGARRPYGRHRVSVAAVTPHAKRADRKHNLLIRALGNG